MSSKTLIGLVAALLVAVVAYHYFSGIDVPLGPPETQPPKLAPTPAKPALPAMATGKVELPSAAPVKPGADLPDTTVNSAETAATSMGNLTGAEKALLTRQALAARGPAPRFSPPPVAQPPVELTALEQRVVDLIEGSPSSIDYKAIDVFELESGTVSSYRLRGEVVRIPLPGTGPNFKTIGHYINFLPTTNRFYVVWEDAGSSSRHYRGPFDGDPYQVLQIPRPAETGSK